jgi:hypothetical protein
MVTIYLRLVSMVSKTIFIRENTLEQFFIFLILSEERLKHIDLDKVVVFWDGEDCQMTRKKIYHQYKVNRTQDD